MNDDITSHKSPDEIRRDIELTRAGLAQKLGALELEVRDSVQDAKSNIRETVDGVKKNLTLSHHIQQRPWPFFAGAVGTGIVVASLLFHQRESHQDYMIDMTPAAQPILPRANGYANGNGHGNSESQHHYLQDTANLLRKATPAISSLGAILQKTFSKEISEGRKLAIGTALGIVRELVKSAVPASATEAAGSMIDDLTRNLGGEPMPAKPVATSRPVVTSVNAAATV